MILTTTFEVRGENFPALHKAAVNYFNDIRPADPNEKRELPERVEFDIRPIEGPGTSELWNPPMIMWEATVTIKETI